MPLAGVVVDRSKRPAAEGRGAKLAIRAAGPELPRTACGKIQRYRLRS